ncbi:MAG: response regulator [Candidatus Limnocylindria bacterium]
MTNHPVLVVDDDAGVRDAVRDLLEIEGYPVVTAGDGAAALRLVDQRRPRLVLLDMRMPGVDGWGFAQLLRERGIQLPVVVMTAAADAVAWAREIGADGHLSKPFEVTDLLEVVTRHSTAD